jgi:hypothetical protein
MGAVKNKRAAEKYFVRIKKNLISHTQFALAFSSLPLITRRDIFACLLLQLLRVNLASFLPRPPLRVAPSRPPSGRAALKSYVPSKFLYGLGSRIQIGANLVAINYRGSVLCGPRSRN